MSLSELLRLSGARAVEHAPLGPLTTYRVGGSARLLLTVENQEDLEELGEALLACQLPVLVLGNGSNLLIEDGEHDIVALRLGEGFRGLDWREEGDSVLVRAGGALDLPVAARRLSAAGIVGFEWAVGVPGTIGGAVAMNAGGHGSDMAHCVETARVWNGVLRSLDVGQLDFAYRHSSLGPGDVVLEATLRLSRGDADEARRRLSEIVAWRRAHQPGGANAGSVFRNPPGDSAGRLIESVGLKGMRRGSAVVSEKHANFILVDARGTARDVFDLAQEVARQVRQATGVELVFEHRLVGFGDSR